jgi:hypothetical protein
MDQIGESEAFLYLPRQSWAYGWIGNEFDWIFPKLSDPKAVDPLPFRVFRG